MSKIYCFSCHSVETLVQKDPYTHFCGGCFSLIHDIEPTHDKIIEDISDQIKRLRKGLRSLLE